MNSESLRRSARAMHWDSGSATREKAVTTATIHYIRGRAPELRMATHLEDPKRFSSEPSQLGPLIRPSLAASYFASRPKRDHPDVVLRFEERSDPAPYSSPA